MTKKDSKYQHIPNTQTAYLIELLNRGWKIVRKVKDGVIVSPPKEKRNGIKKA